MRKKWVNFHNNYKMECVYILPGQPNMDHPFLTIQTVMFKMVMLLKNCCLFFKTPVPRIVDIDCPRMKWRFPSELDDNLNMVHLIFDC